MSDRTERKPIKFSKWSPVRRDYSIAYTYTIPATGREHRSYGDRWQRAKFRIAASALATGATEFRVYGGLRQSWVRTVTCTEEEADRFFRDAIDAGAFMLKGEYRRARAARKRRIAEGVLLDSERVE